MAIPPREGYKTYTLTQGVNYASLKRTLDTTNALRNGATREKNPKF